MIALIELISMKKLVQHGSEEYGTAGAHKDWTSSRPRRIEQREGEQRNRLVTKTEQAPANHRYGGNEVDISSPPHWVMILLLIDSIEYVWEEKEQFGANEVEDIPPRDNRWCSHPLLSATLDGTFDTSAHKEVIVKKRDRNWRIGHCHEDMWIHARGQDRQFVRGICKWQSIPRNGPNEYQNDRRSPYREKEGPICIRLIGARLPDAFCGRLLRSTRHMVVPVRKSSSITGSGKYRVPSCISQSRFACLTPLCGELG